MSGIFVPKHWKETKIGEKARVAMPPFCFRSTKKITVGINNINRNSCLRTTILRSYWL